MRLFYDVYSSWLRGEILLLGADALSIALAVLFATGAIHAASEPWDVVLLVVWSCLPRAFAKLLGGLEFPGKYFRLFGGSLVFVVLTTVLILAGWDLLRTVVPAEHPLDPALLVVIFFTWGVGFFLFHARAYRLHDFLLLAVVVLGLKSSRPIAHAWVPAFIVSFFLATAVRHIINDAFRDVRRPRLNLQNARAFSIVTAGATVCIFFATYFGVHGSLDFPSGAERAADGDAAGRLTADLREGGSDSARSARSASGIGMSAIEKDGGKEGPESRTQEKTIGFSYRIGLRDLTAARFDRREVLRVSAPRDREWRPTASALWRGVSFSTFDPALESWEEETEYKGFPWPGNNTIRRAATGPRESRELLLTYRVVNPVFRNLVSTYVTLSFEARGFAMFRENSFGDVFPSPRPAAGTTYDAWLAPLDAEAVPDAAGTHGSERYMAVPSSRELDMDLPSLARRIFDASGPGVRDRVGALRRYFRREGFRYSNNAAWRTGRGHLREFLLEEKVGDCTYFSTATALLLRAGGLSTRLTVGFLGGEWDAAQEEVVIRNQQAHAWVEAYATGHGWFPVDATSWVPPDPTYVPPPEILAALKGPSRKSGAATGQASDPILPRDRPPTPEGTSRPPPLSRSSDDVGNGRSPLQDLDGESEALGPLEDDLEGWIQYGGLFTYEEDADGGADGGLFLAGGLPLDGSAGPQGDPRLAGDGHDTRQAGDSRRARAGIFRFALRGALASLGSIVLILLVRTFLRPRKPKDAKAQAEDEEEVETEAGQLDPSFLLPELDAAEPRDRVLHDYLKLQETLEKTRSHRMPHQTPLEHARRVTRGVPELETVFLDLHRVLYVLVYGGFPITETHAEVAARSCRKIRRALG